MNSIVRCNPDIVISEREYKELESELDLALKTWGRPIEWRLGQKDAIIQTAHSILNNYHRQIVLDAPTGTGKSIIALGVASLLRYKGLSGYIITSDIMLQTQYENDIKYYGVDIPSVMGYDNYTCSVNEKPISRGMCKISNLNNSEKHQLDCYIDCPYYSRRNAAISAEVSLLNYKYWLLQTNIQSEGRLFKQRHFCIFDESHKIDEIIQSHYAPSLEIKFGDNIYYMLKYLKTILSLPKINLPSWEKTLKKLQTVNDVNIFYSELLNLIDELKKFHKVLYEPLLNYVKKKLAENKNLSAECVKSVSTINKLGNTISSLINYIKIVKDDISSIVLVIDERTLIFKTINMGDLLKNTFHTNYASGLFMTATPGNALDYVTLLGLDKQNLKWISFKYTWDNSNSKINYFIDGPTLNRNNIELQLPIAIKLIDKIIKKYFNKKIIVHTVSYKITQKLLELSTQKNRFIDYIETKNKMNALNEYYDSSDGILIGPSILEGLNLADNDCRCQIFLKIPYLNLGDPFVKGMMNKYPTWYNWKTSLNLLQGSGRAIRNENDYADTWIIDGGFSNFLKRSNHFPDEWKKRLNSIILKKS